MLVGYRVGCRFRLMLIIVLVVCVWCMFFSVVLVMLVLVRLLEYMWKLCVLLKQLGWKCVLWNSRFVVGGWQKLKFCLLLVFNVMNVSVVFVVLVCMMQLVVILVLVRFLVRKLLNMFCFSMLVKCVLVFSCVVVIVMLVGVLLVYCRKVCGVFGEVGGWVSRLIKILLK